MSDIEREAFEREFPVPKDVEWCGNGYAPTKYSADQGYNRMWKVWQAARQAPASGEVEPVGVIELSDYVQLGDDAPIPRRKALAEITEGSIQNLPAGTKLYTHPPAKVPEGWKLVPIESTSDMDIAGMDSLHSSYEGYIIDRDAAEVIWNAMVGAAPTPPQEQ